MSHVDDASAMPVAWWKSSFSDTGAQCVECGIVDEATVAVRDSKYPHGPALLFSREGTRAFVDALRRGELD